MALAQQFCVNLRIAARSTLLVSWTMYGADVLLAVLSNGGRSGVRKKNKPPQRSARMRVLLTAIPALDVCGCLLAHYGLTRLGAGPFTLYFSTILAVSAAISRVLLGTRLSWLQLAGVVLVTGGLLARSLLSGSVAASDDAAGVALTLCATCAYAFRTVAMEAAKAMPGAPTGGELSASIGRWGFATLTLWQVIYTIPRWSELVGRPSSVAGVSAVRALAHHGAYVVARVAFVLSQNRVISVAGATGVGLVTAVRSVVVALASAALFCSHTPSQCLTPTQSACAGLVVAGGVTYALAPPPSAKLKTR